MQTFLYRRVTLTVTTVLLLLVVMFTLLRIIPGSPAEILAGDFATGKDIEELKQAWGLDQPLHVQLLIYLSRVLRGDFGRSVVTRRPVMTEIQGRLRPTLELVLMASLVATVVGLIAGVVSAVRRYSALDGLVMVFAILGVSMPNFWLALLLMLLFGVTLGWFPIVGVGTPAHLVLPSLSLAAAQAAIIARQTRSAMLEVLSQDYVRTARSKGLPERVVIYRHALKNALVPVLTIVGLLFSRLVGGSVVVESVFSRPGMGRLLVDSISLRDYPVVQGVVVVIAVAVAVVNLVIDLGYAWIDPRVRYT
ncbi:MAG: ABC transporter permease [bacterium]|nr:ABC transporter permease [bacterium]